MTETGSPVQCRTCGCLIIFSENNMSQTGVLIPMNFSNNKFGGKGQNHNCRPTYKAPDPSTIDMHVFCPSCLTEHDRRIHPVCPTCFKLLCLKCNHKWIATTFNMYDVTDYGEILRECPECGSMDYESIEDIESWKKAWDQREEMLGLLKCKNCKGKNWIGPAPLVYRKSTKNRDPNKSTTIVSYVEDLPYRDWWKT